jgi:cell division protein FtsL
LEIEILGKKSRAIGTSITNKIQDMEEKIAGAEDSIENTDTTVRENAKWENLLKKKSRKSRTQ